MVVFLIVILYIASVVFCVWGQIKIWKWNVSLPMPAIYYVISLLPLLNLIAFVVEFCLEVNWVPNWLRKIEAKL